MDNRSSQQRYSLSMSYCTYDEVTTFLRYSYTGKLGAVPDSVLNKLTRVARRLSLPSLSATCRAYKQRMISLVKSKEFIGELSEPKQERKDQQCVQSELYFEVVTDADEQTSPDTHLDSLCSGVVSDGNVVEASQGELSQPGKFLISGLRTSLGYGSLHCTVSFH